MPVCRLRCSTSLITEIDPAAGNCRVSEATVSVSRNLNALSRTIHLEVQEEIESEDLYVVMVVQKFKRGNLVRLNSETCVVVLRTDLGLHKSHAAIVDGALQVPENTSNNCAGTCDISLSAGVVSRFYVAGIGGRFHAITYLYIKVETPTIFCHAAFSAHPFSHRALP